MTGDASVKPGSTMQIRVARPLNSLVWVFILFVVALCLLVPLSLVNRRRETVGQDNEIAKPGTLKSAEPVMEASVYRGTPTHTVGASSMPEGSTGHDFALTDEARSLIEEIAKLDDAWESGGVDAGEYQSQRAVWKTKLVDLLEFGTSSESKR